MVGSTDVKTALLNCDGVTTTFPFTFPILDESDLKVYLIDADGSRTLLTITTHYSVSATNDDFSEGGNVETVATYAEGYSILIVRSAVNTQESDYRHADELPADTLEDDIDRRTMVAQEQTVQIVRSLRFPIEDDDDQLGELPPKADRLGKFIRFHETTGLPEMVAAITPETATVTDFMRTVLDDADAAAARATIGAIDDTWTLAGLGEKNFSSLDNDLAALAPDESDEFPFYDITGSAWKKVTRANLTIPPAIVKVDTDEWPYTASPTAPWTNYYCNADSEDRAFLMPHATGSGKIIGVFRVGGWNFDIDVTPDGGDCINQYNVPWKINAVLQYVILQDRAIGEWHVLGCLGTLLGFTSSADVSGGTTKGVWVNPAGHSLAVTVGSWLPFYQIRVEAQVPSATYTAIYAGLGLANNSVLADFASQFYDNLGASGVYAVKGASFCMAGLEPVIVAAPTTYYLNIRCDTSTAGLTALSTKGTATTTKICFRRIA